MAIKYMDMYNYQQEAARFECPHVPLTNPITVLKNMVI